MSFVFAYGSLQKESVMRHVVDRIPPARAGVLAGFARRRIVDLDFPGIAENGAESVDGHVFGPLTDEEMARMDEYEADFYVRKTVKVKLNDSDEVVACEAYCVPEEDAPRLLSDDHWTLDDYQREF